MITIAGIDRIAGLGLERLYDNTTTGYQGRINSIIKHTGSPIIVVGSSWALHHYVPQILTQSTSLDVTNCGLEGQGITTNYALIRAVTQRYQPELIVYDINPHYDVNNNPGTGSFERVRTFTTLKCRDSLLIAHDPLERIRLMSRIYTYNSTLLDVIATSIAGNSIYDSPESDNGYIPQHHTLSPTARPPYINEASCASNEKIELITRLMTDYKGHIIFFTSPSFTIRHEMDKACNQVKALAARYGVPYHDMRADTTLTGKPELWDDYDHLNDTGAHIYSKHVAAIINDFLR